MKKCEKCGKEIKGDYKQCYECFLKSKEEPKKEDVQSTLETKEPDMWERKLDVSIRQIAVNSLSTIIASVEGDFKSKMDELYKEADKISSWIKTGKK